jgi:fibro-slime domain-containing protein
MKRTCPNAPRTLFPLIAIGMGCGLLANTLGCGDSEKKKADATSEVGGTPGAGGAVGSYGGLATSAGGLAQGDGGSPEAVGGAAPGAGGKAGVACTNNGECADQGALTTCDTGRGHCVECLTSKTCAETEVCRAGTCVADAGCLSGAKCPEGLVCNALGACSQCATRSDCSNGESCIGYECRPACSSSDDCAPYGLRCNLGLGYCVECITDESCSTGRTCGDGGVCVVGVSTGTGGSGSEGGTSQGGESGVGGDSGVGGVIEEGGSGGAADMGGAAGSGEIGGTAGGGGAENAGNSGVGGAVMEEGCGDGNLDAGESCDDGNLADGDCCSATCVMEEGCTCTQSPTSTDSVDLKVTYRDFSSEHADFEPGASGLNEATTGLIEESLDTDGKPVLIAADTGYITSPETFSQWYRDVEGTNGTTQTTFRLWKSGDIGYVNRADSSGGSQFISWQEIAYCEKTDCSGCDVGEGLECLSPCTPWGNDQTCKARRDLLDGDPYFFPIDSSENNITPEGELATAALAPAYGGAEWPAQPGGGLHNFHFTSEIRFLFHYDSSRTYSVDFLGDDDAWIFVNNSLAVDLGGIHTPVQGTTTVDGATFGLENGKTYEIVVFQAERQTQGSTYRLTLSGFGFGRSICTKPVPST